MREDSANSTDRRRNRRFSINAPLTVITEDREIPAYTRNLSNTGVYFCLALADGAMIKRDFEFMIEFPPEITLSTRCRIRGRGRLVRTETIATGMAGVAAKILDYSMMSGAKAD